MNLHNAIYATYVDGLVVDGRQLLMTLLLVRCHITACSVLPPLTRFHCFPRQCSPLRSPIVVFGAHPRRNGRLVCIPGKERDYFLRFLDHPPLRFEFFGVGNGSEVGMYAPPPIPPMPILMPVD